MRTAYLSFILIISVFLKMDAQISIDFKAGLRSNISTYQDPFHPNAVSAINGHNKTLFAHSPLGGLEFGYSFIENKIRLKTGILYSQFSSTFFFRRPLVYYGIDNFDKIFLDYNVFEVPIQIEFKLLDLSKKMYLSASFGASYLRIVNDDSDKIGQVSEFSDEYNDSAYLDYFIYTDEYLRTGISLNTELSLVYSITERVNLTSSIKYSLGLLNGPSFIFLYSTYIEGQAPVRGDAISSSKWDNISSTIGVQYFFNKK